MTGNGETGNKEREKCTLMKTDKLGQTKNIQQCLYISVKLLQYVLLFLVFSINNCVYSPTSPIYPHTTMPQGSLIASKICWGPTPGTCKYLLQTAFHSESCLIKQLVHLCLRKKYLPARL